MGLSTKPDLGVSTTVFEIPLKPTFRNQHPIFQTHILWFGSIPKWNDAIAAFSTSPSFSAPLSFGTLALDVDISSGPKSFARQYKTSVALGFNNNICRDPVWGRGSGTSPGGWMLFEGRSPSFSAPLPFWHFGFER